MDSKLTAIVGLFAYEGRVGEIKPLGEGLINDTYKVKTVESDKPDYVLQRVNHTVFPDVDMVMRNIDAVTSHIRSKFIAAGVKDIDRRVLRFIPAKADGKLYVKTPTNSPSKGRTSGEESLPIEGEVWRGSVPI